MSKKQKRYLTNDEYGAICVAFMDGLLDTCRDAQYCNSDVAIVLSEQLGFEVRESHVKRVFKKMGVSYSRRTPQLADPEQQEPDEATAETLADAPVPAEVSSPVTLVPDADYREVLRRLELQQDRSVDVMHSLCSATKELTLSVNRLRKELTEPATPAPVNGQDYGSLCGSNGGVRCDD